MGCLSPFSTGAGFRNHPQSMRMIQLQLAHGKLRSKASASLVSEKSPQITGFYSSWLAVLTILKNMKVNG
jgi:hypothetical protein